MYDCIIIGGGPAGGAAAYQLAKQGRRVLILEKSPLPRYKPCGGGVAPVVQQWFDFDFTPAISYQVDRVCYTWGGQDPVDVTLANREPTWMVRREVFDRFLLQQAEGQGAQLQDNSEVVGIEFLSDRWQVSTAQTSFVGRYLIGADGAKGPTANWLGFKRRRRLVAALEVEFPLIEQPPSLAWFDFGIIQQGYAWNFPKADGYSLGVGDFLGGGKQNYKEILGEYAQLFGVEASAIKSWGHPLCLWDGHQALHSQHALLAGEAACVVDPFTAEGIRPSIFSGLQAARSIDRAIAGDSNALENYTRVMAEEWGAQMVWAKRLAQVFYRLPQVGYRVGIKRPSATLTMSKVMAGELRYSDVVARALKRLLGR
ncbi:MAG: geranylgeranyl reductase family protein [Chloroflexaceae bacterium]|nr:geranylgeranyl reductase family protein [Chloroflexaceae bacterium]